MRFIFLAFALIAAPAAAQPPREELPASQELLDQVGQGNSDAAIAQAIAEASVHPLGTLANPVRVGGPEGARAYLGRLRCGNGAAPTIGERAPAGVGTFGTVVDAWPLDCGAAAPGSRSLVIDLYHDGHVEDRAPAGFAITPR